jgi:hypothetical protein
MTLTLTTPKPGVALVDDHALSTYDTGNSVVEPTYRLRHLLTLNQREMEFLKLVCTEWTYK